MENPEPVWGAVRATYRYLRLGMVLLVVFLTASIIIARLSAACLQSTISDYYFTTAHPVFIGAICALGACLIAYQGSSDTENALLNFSGFLALIIALVPTARPDLCGPGLPGGYDAAVGDNIKALLVATALALVIHLVIKVRSIARHPSPPPVVGFGPGGRFLDWMQRLLPWLLAGILLAGAVYFWLDRAQFEQHAHRWAAGAMFSGIVCVVMINAVYACQRIDCGRMRRIAVTLAYIAIAVLMAVTLVAAIIVHILYGPLWQRDGVIGLESALILWFAIYWAVQTADLWNVSDYRRVLPARPKFAVR